VRGYKDSTSYVWDESKDAIHAEVSSDLGVDDLRYVTALVGSVALGSRCALAGAAGHQRAGCALHGAPEGVAGGLRCAAVLLAAPEALLSPCRPRR
jgi:hypothetical protein